MNISEKTATCLKAIMQSKSEAIAPITFSYCFGRSATSAAFRIAKREGLIEVAYTSCVGTPVYRLTQRTRH